MEVLNKNINTDYGVKDIKTLEGIEVIRLRPGINNYLSALHKYNNCESQKGDKCDEPRCIKSIMTLGNGVSFFCGK